jgi:predicted acyltransferase
MKTSNSHPGTDNRLYSLDALRGFDMLWITGGGSFFVVLANLTGSDWLKSIAEQMEHVPWNGFHFFDLIFPLFMFISGVAIPLSVQSKLKKNVSKKSLFLKVFKRMIILVLLGFLYNGLFRNGFKDARYVSVLGQIGVSYFFASVIVIFSKSYKTNLLWLAGILIGVAILQLFVPVPGIGAGILTPAGHINGYIDRLFLPGRLAYDNGIYDAIGYLSIISAIGITLMGTIAGNILQQKKYTEYRKTGILTVIGIALITTALFLSPYYPIIKNCWTTTYNILAGGISFLLIALFYLVIDVWRYRGWSFYFRVIGMNSIFAYLFTRIVPISNIVEFFIGWIAKPMGGFGGLIIAVGVLTGIWLLLYYMYKNNIFIKV